MRSIPKIKKYLKINGFEFDGIEYSEEYISSYVLRKVFDVEEEGNDFSDIIEGILKLFPESKILETNEHIIYWKDNQPAFDTVEITFSVPYNESNKWVYD